MSGLQALLPECSFLNLWTFPRNPSRPCKRTQLQRVLMFSQINRRSPWKTGQMETRGKSQNNTVLAAHLSASAALASLAWQTRKLATAAGCQRSVPELPQVLINIPALFSNWYIKVKTNLSRSTVFQREPLAPEGMDSIIFTAGYSNPIYFLMHESR